MAIFSKKQMQEKAIQVFEQYADKDKVFAREDGNIFFNENWAELGRGKLKVYPFDRSDLFKKEKTIEDIEVDAQTVAPKEAALEADKTLGKDGKNPETRNANNKK